MKLPLPKEFNIYALDVSPSEHFVSLKDLIESLSTPVGRDVLKLEDDISKITKCVDPRHILKSYLDHYNTINLPFSVSNNKADDLKCVYIPVDFTFNLDKHNVLSMSFALIPRLSFKSYTKLPISNPRPNSSSFASCIYQNIDIVMPFFLKIPNQFALQTPFLESTTTPQLFTATRKIYTVTYYRDEKYTQLAADITRSHNDKSK